MAMLAGQMLMQPEVRKGMGKMAKYLLLFGGLGVAVIAFIVLAKKFDPLKMVGNFFSNAFKGVNSFFKNVLGGVGGLFGGVGGAVGGLLGGLFGKKGPIEEKDYVRRGGQVEGDENLRREFRRYAILVTRVLGVLKNEEGIPKDMSARISLVQSAFKKADKTFVRDIAKQFEVVWDRKREVLKGNLEKSFEYAERVALADKYAKEGKSYASKLILTVPRGVLD